MSKKFLGKLCAYCHIRESTRQGDHIFARKFFLERDRQDLPKVPACDQCNNEKSLIEHYLAGVLPFGGLHDVSEENLVTLVPARLEKNRKLKSELQVGMNYRNVIDHNGREDLRLVIPFDGERYAKLFEFIAKGLSLYHWGTYINENSITYATSLSACGVQNFRRFFSLNTPNRIENSIANNTFSYAGVQAVDNDQMSFWFFESYNGLTGAEVIDDKEYYTSTVGAFTGPPEKMNKLLELFSR